MGEISKLFEQPELIKSPQTNKIYTVIARKGESKLAINCTLTTPGKSGGASTVGLTLRMIEVMSPKGQEWPTFNAFGFRGRDIYPSKDGPDIYLFRGDMYYMPVTASPCSTGDFLKSLEVQSVVSQLASWLEGHVVACGGVLVVGIPTLQAIIGAAVDEVPSDLPMLFKLPTLNPKVNGFSEDEKPKSMGQQPPHPPEQDDEDDEDEDYPE